MDCGVHGVAHPSITRGSPNALVSRPPHPTYDPGRRAWMAQSAFSTCRQGTGSQLRLTQLRRIMPLHYKHHGAPNRVRLHVSRRLCFSARLWAPLDSIRVVPTPAVPDLAHCEVPPAPQTPLSSGLAAASGPLVASPLSALRRSALQLSGLCAPRVTHAHCRGCPSPLVSSFCSLAHLRACPLNFLPDPRPGVPLVCHQGFQSPAHPAFLSWLASLPVVPLTLDP